MLINMLLLELKFFIVTQGLLVSNVNRNFWDFGRGIFNSTFGTVIALPLCNQGA